MVQIRRWLLPSSLIALRAAFIRTATADSETIRPSKIFSISSSLLTILTALSASTIRCDSNLGSL
jgi:hypothetical protein